MSNHEHRVISTRTVPYTGGAKDPRCAGNITIVERCRCQAMRETHVNAGISEDGPWVPLHTVMTGVVHEATEDREQVEILGREWNESLGDHLVRFRVGDKELPLTLRTLVTCSRQDDRETAALYQKILQRAVGMPYPEYYLVYPSAE